MAYRRLEGEPHFLFCILQELKYCLESTERFPVSCHRDDCWSDIDLNKCQCAVNLVLESQNQIERKQGRRGPGVKRTECVYEMLARFKIEIYALGCESLYDAMVCMTVAQEALCQCGPFRHLEETNSNFTTTQEGDTEMTLIELFYDLRYLHDPCDPSKKQCKQKEE